MGEEKAIIFPCFGGSSNVGVVTALATPEVVQEVGLDKAGIDCLEGLPTNANMVYQNTAVTSLKALSEEAIPRVRSKTVYNALLERATNS